MNRKKFIAGIFILISLASLVYASILWSDGALTKFLITAGNPVCDYDEFNWKWWEGGELKEKNSLDDCFRDNGWPSTTCCPEESECKLDLATPTKTCTGISAPEVCSDYNAERYGGDIALAEQHCKGFHIDVAKRSMEIFTGIEGFCDGYKISAAMDKDLDGELETCSKDVYDCRCIWKDGVCEQQASYSDWICPGDGDITSDNCTALTMRKEDKCEQTGYINYGWKAIWTGTEADKPDWCMDNERKIKCGARLNFFTIASLISAVILIIVIYLLLRKRKNRREKRKKH